MLFVLAFLLLFTSQVSAASLEWDGTADGFVWIEYSATPDGVFEQVEQVPAYPPRYPLIPGKFGYYRIYVSPWASNVVKYTLDVESGDDSRLDSLEARVTALEKPVTVNNITAKQLDANRIEVTGQACTSLKTTGSGLKRIVECIH